MDYWRANLRADDTRPFSWLSLGLLLVVLGAAVCLGGYIAAGDGSNRGIYVGEWWGLHMFFGPLCLYVGGAASAGLGKALIILSLTGKIGA